MGWNENPSYSFHRFLLGHLLSFTLSPLIYHTFYATSWIYMLWRLLFGYLFGDVENVCSRPFRSGADFLYLSGNALGWRSSHISLRMSVLMCIWTVESLMILSHPSSMIFHVQGWIISWSKCWICGHWVCQKLKTVEVGIASLCPQLLCLSHKLGNSVLDLLNITWRR